MKRMHAFVQQPVVIKFPKNGLDVNSEGGKILAACFDDAENKKPLPYKIFFNFNSEGYFYEAFLTYKDNKYDFVCYDLQGENLYASYDVKDEIQDGKYHYFPH